MNFNFDDLARVAKQASQKPKVKTANQFQGAWTNEPQPGPQELDPVKATIAWLQSDPSQWYAIKFEGYAGDDGTYQIVGLSQEPASVKDLAAAFGMDPTDLANQSEDGYFAYANKQMLLNFCNLSLTNPTETYEARNDDQYFQHPSNLNDYNELLGLEEFADDEPDFNADVEEDDGNTNFNG